MDDADAQIKQLTEQLRLANERIGVLEAKLAEADARNAELEAENEQLRERVQDLECKLGRDSNNSHRPPSTDDPFGNDSDDGDGGDVIFDFDSSATQGAQPGHEGHSRELLDADEVDEVVEIKPDECISCGAHFIGEDLAPWRHQVFEIVIERHVTEYRCHRLECDECGHSQRAELPDGVPNSAFGDTLCAWTSWLSGQFDLSKRDLETLIEEGFEIPISLGSVGALERRAQAALSPAHAQALEALFASKVLWVDETGWFEQNERGWLWVAVGDDQTQVTAFRIDPSRSRAALEELVDADFDGIVSSDRYNAYNGRDPDDRQICWQHLIRDFKGLMARDGPQAEPAGHLLCIAWLIFWTIDRIRRGEASWEELQQRVDQTWRPATRIILERAAETGEMPEIFGNLLGREAALWTFAYVDEVEPTNNRAERAVRPGVIKRKL